MHRMAEPYHGGASNYLLASWKRTELPPRAWKRVEAQRIAKNRGEELEPFSLLYPTRNAHAFSPSGKEVFYCQWEGY